MLLAYGRLDPEEQCRLDRMVAGTGDRRRNFTVRQAEGAGMNTVAFSPSVVIVRLSDFKASEYAAQFGGHHFKPSETVCSMLAMAMAWRYYAVRRRVGIRSTNFRDISQ